MLLVVGAALMVGCGNPDADLPNGNKKGTEAAAPGKTYTKADAAAIVPNRGAVTGQQKSAPTPGAPADETGK